MTDPRLHDAAARTLRRADDERSMLAEVRAGLSRPQKELPPKFFYDRRGSELFEEITRLPEYYLTRAERALLVERIPDLIARLRPRTLVELGAGSAEKSRIILDAMRHERERIAYVPVDVSAEFLRDVATRLRAEYPGLEVRPVAADITHDLGIPRDIRRPALIAFLGSTIGNFHPVEAIRLLRRVRAAMVPGDRFLLGVDLRKDPAVLERAYNDERGLTAEFNRNVLRVLNRELGSNFDPDAFAHRAFYDPLTHRIEMHLVAQGAQMVTIPGIGVVVFRDGESVRTEISGKHDRGSVDTLFAAAGLLLEEWIAEAEQRFALAVGTPA